MMVFAIISQVTIAVFNQFPLFGFFFRIVVEVMERSGIL